jgi:hypothetical protein
MARGANRRSKKVVEKFRERDYEPALALINAGF